MFLNTFGRNPNHSENDRYLENNSKNTASNVWEPAKTCEKYIQFQNYPLDLPK